MDIIFFAHPPFLHLRSMDNFTYMLSEGMRERGHNVEVWHPKATFSRFATGTFTRKWLGYLDQYVLFPATVQSRIKSCKKGTLYVFTDQALGPWVSLVQSKRHIIHCHDFLALESSLGLIKENKTRWLGRNYQQYIKKGFSNGRNFIAVSKHTSEQLQSFHPELYIRNEVVYNWLNKVYHMTDISKSREFIELETGIKTIKGYIMHVGGNQWYKNRKGVVEVYNSWRHTSSKCLPLLLIGEKPSSDLLQQISRSPYNKEIYYLANKSDEFIQNAYSGASLLLYPSLAEGFGWPIAEAMACGCLVITTNLAPMTEVGADAAFYVDSRPSNNKEVPFWAHNVAELMENIICFPDDVRQKAIDACLQNARRFDNITALNRIESIYLNVN